MFLPALNPKNRSREFLSYSSLDRAKMFYAYLFEGIGYREIDNQILGMNQGQEGWKGDTRGWQSKSTLSYLGITKEHKAIFKDLSVSEAIQIIKHSTYANQSDEEYWAKIIAILSELQ